MSDLFPNEIDHFVKLTFEGMKSFEYREKDFEISNQLKRLRIIAVDIANENIHITSKKVSYTGAITKETENCFCSVEDSIAFIVSTINAIEKKEKIKTILSK